MKTTASGLHEEYLRERQQIEEVGSRSLVVDSDGHGVAVIETTASELKRLGNVGLQFAIDEGEGFETVEAWREAHVRFFTSPEMVAARRQRRGRPREGSPDHLWLLMVRPRLAIAAGRRPPHASWSGREVVIRPVTLRRRRGVA